MIDRFRRMLLWAALASFLCPPDSASQPASDVALKPEPAVRPDPSARLAAEPAVGVHPFTQPLARPATARHTGTQRALVLFAGFAGDTAPVPAWAEDLFDPDLPGSFRHFYDTMSFGQLQVEGVVAPRRYLASQPATAYLADDPVERGQYGRFTREILEQADRDLDFSTFDRTGDGVVDVVFIVLEHTPARFLIGNATGVGRLGLEEDYVATSSARPVRVRDAQGTLQRGRTFTEAAASMAHEYGHVLGLPDLYNTDFVRQVGAPPEDDSAGIGAWGLMGWGTLGWSGNDGPNSFSAFSREQLGWSEVIEVRNEHQTIRLTDVGEGGPIYRVPLRPWEYLLLEYRRRGGNYYDRKIPGEGLLIWRVRWRRREGEELGRWLVSLECADGRWTDAGYPLGTVPAPRQGGTNLDFWARDEVYRTAHAGNLGDATDPFDGVRFTAFTPETNPAAYSTDGELSVRIEDIRIADGVVTAAVSSEAMQLTLDHVRFTGAASDGLLVAGETLMLFVQVTNTGGLAAEDVHGRLHTDDPWLHIERPEVHFGSLAIGQRSEAPLTTFPQVRLSPEAIGMHQAQLTLDLYANGARLDRRELELTGVSPRQSVRGWTVVDSLGNADGRVQAGEFFRLDLDLEAEKPVLLAQLTFTLRPLHPLVLVTGDTALRVSPAHETGSTLQSPEFLTLSGLAPGTLLDFEFAVSSPFVTWRDTLRVPVAPGPPPSAPRVYGLNLRSMERTVRVTLNDTQVLGGSPVHAVHAHIRPLGAADVLARVPLAVKPGGYGGSWTAPAPKAYKVLVAVEDAAGQKGYSPSQTITVVDLPEPAPDPPGAWRAVELPAAGWRPGLNRLAFAPSHPEMIYGVDAHALWRSADGGSRWERTGWMNGERVRRIFVDAVDPLTVYLRSDTDQLFVSRDGGGRWTELEAPAPLLAADLHRPGRLYAGDVASDTGTDLDTVTASSALDSARDNGAAMLDALNPGAFEPGAGGHEPGLWISADYGASWMATGVEAAAFVQVHPRARDLVYAGVLRRWIDGRHQPGLLAYSEDGGRTWTHQTLDQTFERLVVDAHRPGSLYAVQSRTLWCSDDHGARWTARPLPAGSAQLAPYSASPAQWLLWNSSGLWHSEDGHQWRPRSLPPVRIMPAMVRYRFDLYPHPRDPERLFTFVVKRLLHQGDFGLWRSEDGGQRWTGIERDPVPAPVGALYVAPDGRFYVSSGRVYGDPGRILIALDARPGLYRRDDDNGHWVWYGEVDGAMVDSPFDRLPAFESLFQDPRNPRFMLAQEAPAYLLGDGHSYATHGRFYQSTDQGRTWQPAAIPPPRRSGTTLAVLAADPFHAGTYYVAGGGTGVWRGSDGGAWQRLDDGLPVPVGEPHNDGLAPDPRVGGFALDPASPGVLYAAVGDTLWRRTADHPQWTYHSHLGDRHRVRQLTFAPLAADRLYALTDHGLLVSRDQGRSWSSLVDMPLGSIVGHSSPLRLRFHPLEPMTLLLVTGPQLLESRDGGRTWQEPSPGPAAAPWFFDVAVDPTNSRTLYASTSWGLYRLERDEPTAVADGDPARPTAVALGGNHPNPFNAVTVIPYQLPYAAPVRLTVFNVLGQPVRTLVDQHQPAGAHQVIWDGTDDRGRPAASGVYFYRLSVNEPHRTGTSVRTVYPSNAGIPLSGLGRTHTRRLALIR